MSIREPDHRAVRNWLAHIERHGLDTKAAAAMQFPAFGGGAYGFNNDPQWGNGNGSWYNYYLPGATRDYAAEAGDLWRNSAVAACLGWISDNFCEPVLEVARKKRGGEHPEPVDGSALVKLLGEPNPDYDTDALWAATVLSFTISGNAYWIKCKSPGGRTLQLYWAPYWEIEPRWNTTGRQFIDHYDHVVDGRRYPLRKEDVVHFRRGLNPTNVRSGLPQLEPVLREIVADNAANSYVAAILRNMGVPGVVLMPEADNVTIDRDDADDLKSLWVERTTGDNIGKPIVPSVRLKIQELTATPEKLTLDRIRQVPEARICAAFRLPAMVVGLSVGEQQRTYANMAVAERMAYRNCLVPLQKTFAKALTRQILPDMADYRPGDCARWNYATVEAMGEEQDVVAERSVLLFTGGVISQEEARAKVGHGKAKPGDTFVQPRLASEKPGATGDQPEGKNRPLHRPQWRQLAAPHADLVRVDDHDLGDARRLLAVAARAAGVTLHSGPLPTEEGHRAIEALMELAGRKLADDTLALIGEIETKGLAGDAQAKVDAWRDRTGAFLRKVYLAAALALSNPLSSSGLAAFGDAHQIQVAKLHNRARDILNETQALDGTLPARVKLYSEAAWGVAENVRRAEMHAAGMTREARMMGGTHHCEDCPPLASLGWQPIGSLPPIGATQCSNGCRCYFVYA